MLGQIRSPDDIERAYIFFTTNRESCPPLLGIDIDLQENSSDTTSWPWSSSSLSSSESTNDRSGVFPLKWNIERSKFAIADQPRIALRKLKNQRSQRRNTHDNSALDSLMYPSTSLLVAEFTAQLQHSASEYFTCLHVATKKLDNNENSESFKFTHQGNNKLAFAQIVTTKDLLPIFLVVIFYLILLAFSALFSGLNLGKLIFKNISQFIVFFCFFLYFYLNI